MLPKLRSYAAWNDTFVALGERAACEGRAFDPALYFRCAEFFVNPSDPRKALLRARRRALDHRARIHEEKYTHEHYHFESVPLVVRVISN